MRFFSLLTAFVLGLSGAASALAQSPAHERMKTLQADPAAQQAAIAAGKKASFFCANCHGDNGIAKTTDVPNLAGQHPSYLLEQIRKFGSGERKDQFMQGLIKVLNDEERAQITLYYASIVVPPAKADPEHTKQGKVLYEKLCARCHGPGARGTEIYPRLAGQQQPYLQKSITHYRDGTGVRNNPLMAVSTAGLKNPDILALSHFLAQLP
ncbi:c-type cytochrome [Azonexus sp.]|uniref:c-type cytochrome n=1 Tax=Azonexus sp. TaxID=1872668 RepID=UPI0039E2E104